MDCDIVKKEARLTGKSEDLPQTSLSFTGVFYGMLQKGIVELVSPQYALQFNGVNQYCQRIAGLGAIEYEKITIEFWIKIPSVSGVYQLTPIISTANWVQDGEDMTLASGFTIGIEGITNRMRFHIGGDEPQNILLSGGLNNQWHHVAFTTNFDPHIEDEDEKEYIGYIDGVSHTGLLPCYETNFHLTDTFSIGRNSRDEYGAFIIDHLRISTINRYPVTSIPGYPESTYNFVPDSNTLAYYKFDEGSGSTILDQTTNHYDLVSQGDPTYVTGYLGE
jgi:hypothetical protein